MTPDNAPVTAEPPASWRELCTLAALGRNVTLVGGMSLHAVNVFIVATVLPSVVGEIGGLRFYAWNTTLFVVASVLGSATAAQLLRAWHPRGAYTWAALVFALGSMTCALAPTMPVMLIGRTLQGLGGGWMVAISYAMIRLLYRPALWPMAMGLISAAWGVATLIGPAVGGFWAEWGAWRAGFSFTAGTALGFVVLARSTLPKTGDASIAQTARLPRGQLVLLTLAVLSVCVGNVLTTVAAQALALLVGGALLAVLAWREVRGPDRLLPTGALAWRGPYFLRYVAMGLLVGAVTPELFLPYFLQALAALSPLEAGYLTACMSAGWTLGSLATATLDTRHAPRLLWLGMGLQLVALLALTVAVPHLAPGHWLLWAVGVAMLILGLGIGVAWPHLLPGVMRAAPPHEENLAATSVTTVELTAIALTSALGGLVVNLAGLDRLPDGAGVRPAALWLCGLFALLPTVGLGVAAALAKRGRA